MITSLTKEDLIKFEDEIAEIYNSGVIKSVVHLYSGGEEDFLRIFQNIHPNDWVMCGWRSHYQCLLKGVPREEVKREILAGNSVHLCFPEYRVFSSGIVGGLLPIATGIALANRRSGEDSVVHCFIGDMTAETGIAHECVKYSQGHELPICFHVEDNGVSIGSDTKKLWGISEPSLKDSEYVDRFHYKMGKYPHAGAGTWVQF